MTLVAANAITVVIPTFNRCERLKKAVESVLQETRVPVTLKIFDNASTDGTADYLAQLAASDSRVEYSRSATNIGGHENYVRALSSITSAYFIPLADDDWLLPDFVFNAHSILEHNADVGAAVFITEVRNEAGELGGTYPSAIDKIQFGLLTPKQHLHDWLLYGHYAWSSILWRTATLDCVGAPYLHVGLPSDVDFQAQIFCRCPVYLVNQPGAVYLLHENQASRGFNTSHLQSWATLFRRLDRSALQDGLFSMDEYLPLRHVAQQRYRGAWSAPVEAQVSATEMVSAASAAGFSLGDWTTAFSFIEKSYQLDSTRSPQKALGRRVLVLPEVATIKGAPEQVQQTHTDSFIGAVIRWMKDRVEASDEHKAEVERLTAESDALKTQVEQLAASATAHRVAGKDLEQRCALAESELTLLKSRRLVRMVTRFYRPPTKTSRPPTNGVDK